MAPHSGDWLSALPIASCGLRMDDESVRVAVALRLGLGVCVPHSCLCGEAVDAWGQHAFVCKHASGRTQRHHALNDIVARSFASAGIPASKEPSGSIGTALNVRMASHWCHGSLEGLWHGMLRL